VVRAVQASCSAWQTAPREDHHKAKLAFVLVKGLAEASGAATGGDRVLLEAALADVLPHILSMATVPCDGDSKGSTDSSRDDVEDELQVSKSLQRVSAAEALLLVSKQVDHLLPADAYLALAYAVQDPSSDVCPVSLCLLVAVQDLRDGLCGRGAPLANSPLYSACAFG
jgi:hypothetical protein